MVLQTIKREDILKNLLSFDHVHPLTGTNPLLLSLALKETDLGEVRSVVDSKVDDYMTNNLKLDKNLQLLSSYIVNQRLTSTTKFAYCACWHGELADENKHDYESTCLAMHHLTVVEEESVETLTVQNDQDDATSTTNVENSSDFKRKILRWNFPTFGDIYINILKTLLIKLTAMSSRKFVERNQALLAFGLKESFFIS